MNEASSWYALDWEARAERGGEVVGPVSLATVHGWLEQQALGKRAELRKLGSREWIRAQTVLASATELRTDRGSVAEAAAPAPRARSARLIGVAVTFGVVLFASALGVAYRLHYFDRWRDARSLPIAGARLPNRTSFISERRLASDLEEFVELPPEYAASSLAALACGGTDVIDLLTRARGKDLGWQQDQGLLDLIQNEDWRQALSCGEAVRKSMVEPKFARVSFVDGDKTSVVGLVRASVAELSGKWAHHSFSGFSGQCEATKDVTTACAPDGRATFYDPPLRIVGGLDAVEAFARSYASKHDELSTNVEILDQLIGLTDSADTVALSAKPEHVDFADICQWAAPVVDAEAFVKACFPAGQERLIASIETKIRGLSEERDFLTKNRVHWEKILLARDDDAGASIEKDLLDLVRDWQAQLENNEPELVKIYRKPSTFIHDDLMRAGLDPILRGLHGMKVTRRGQVVRLIVNGDSPPRGAQVSARIRRHASPRSARGD